MEGRLGCGVMITGRELYRCGRGLHRAAGPVQWPLPDWDRRALQEKEHSGEEKVLEEGSWKDRG